MRVIYRECEGVPSSRRGGTSSEGRRLPSGEQGSGVGLGVATSSTSATKNTGGQSETC